MAITLADVKFFHSQVNDDSDNNGGSISNREVDKNAGYPIFPIVTKEEASQGIIRYRKIFITSADQWGYNLYYTLLKPPASQFKMYIRPGTFWDTQADIKNATDWYGCGKLVENANRETHLLNTEFVDNDYTFNKNDTIAVGIFDNNQIKFTNVRYYTVKGFRKALSYNSIPDGSYIVIDNPDQALPERIFTYDKSYDSNGTEQINNNKKYEINNYDITTTSPQGDVTFNGQLVRTHSPIEGSDTIEDSPQWVQGNKLKIETLEQLMENYTPDSTYVGRILKLGNLKPEITNIQVNSPSGYVNKYKMSFNTLATIEESWTITFTSSTEFICEGQHVGNVGTGNISSVFQPTNPTFNQPYFIINTDFWEGTFAANDTVTFTTLAAAKAVWLKLVIPPGTKESQLIEWSVFWDIMTEDITIDK